MTEFSTGAGHGTDANMKQTLNAKCPSQDLPPAKYIAHSDRATTSKARSQLINLQSGFGCAISQVGSSAIPAVQNIHFAAVERGNSAGGRVLHRIRKRYAQRTGTNHPKLYSGLVVQCRDRSATRTSQSAPKTATGMISRVRF